MANVGTLAYLITADNGELISKLRESDNAIDKTAANGETQANRIKSFLAKAFTAAAIVGFVKDTFAAGAQYEQAMAQFRVASGATAEEMQRASDAALALGNDSILTSVSARDAGIAMEELAKGGLSAEQSMAAARGTLMLATAANIEAGQAAELTADALNAFGLEGDQASRVANVLAGAANAATGGIEDFGLGLAQSATVAHSFGISVEDATTALAAMANAGIKGSDAGTSLKTMLLSLASPSKQQAAAFAELGVQAYDASGEFVGLEAISGQLAAAQARLTTEQFNAAASTAFGTDAMRAAVVMANTGADGFDDLRSKVTQAGQAQALAAAHTEGMAGAIGEIGNAIETAQLEFFLSESSAVEEVVRRLADIIPDAAAGILDVAAAAGQVALVGANGFLAILQAVTPLIQGVATLAGFIGNLPGPVLAAGAAMLILSRNSDGLGRMFSGMTAPFRGFLDQMRLQQSLAASSGVELGKWGAAAAVVQTRAGGLRGAMSSLVGMMGGPLTLGLTAGIALFSAISNAKAKAAERAREMTAAANSVSDALNQSNGAIDANVIATSLKALKDTELIGVADKLGMSQTELAIAYAKGGSALEAHAKQLLIAAEASGNFQDIAEAARFANLVEELGDVEAAQEAVAEAAQEQAGSFADAESKANALADAMSEVREEADKTAAAQLDANAAVRALESAYAAAAEAIGDEGFVATLDASTEAGRENGKLLDDIAKQAIVTRDAFQAKNEELDVTRQMMAEARADYIKTAVAMGMTAEEAAAMADHLNLIPENIQTNFELNSAADFASILDEIGGKVVELSTGGYAIHLSAPLADETQKKLETLGFAVRDLPDGKQVLIAQHGAEDAETAINDLGESAADVPGTLTIDLYTKDQVQVINELNAITGATNSVPKVVSTSVTTNSTEVLIALEALNIKATTLKDGTIVIDDNSDETVAKLAALNLKTEALSDGTILVTDNTGSVITNLTKVDVKTGALKDGSIVVTDNSGTVIANLAAIDAKRIKDKYYTIYSTEAYAGRSAAYDKHYGAAGGLFGPGTQFMADGGVPSTVDGHRISGRRPSESLAVGARMLTPGTNQIMPGGVISGDRLDVPELYTPLDGSKRSLSLLSLGAAAFGKVLADPNRQGSVQPIIHIQQAPQPAPQEPRMYQVNGVGMDEVVEKLRALEARDEALYGAGR